MKATKTHHANGRVKAPKKIWVYRDKSTYETYTLICPLTKQSAESLYLIGTYRLLKEGK
jgi:hypothetical protein